MRQGQVPSATDAGKEQISGNTITQLPLSIILLLGKHLLTLHLRRSVTRKPYKG